MAETRVQVAYHFKIDPSQQTRLPEQIIRTVSVGTEIVHTEKVSSDCLDPLDRAVLTTEIGKLSAEATRTAKPVGASTAHDPSAPVGSAEEESAF